MQKEGILLIHIAYANGAQLSISPDLLRYVKPKANNASWKDRFRRILNSDSSEIGEVFISVNVSIDVLDSGLNECRTLANQLIATSDDLRINLKFSDADANIASSSIIKKFSDADANIASSNIVKMNYMLCKDGSELLFNRTRNHWLMHDDRSNPILEMPNE